MGERRQEIADVEGTVVLLALCSGSPSTVVWQPENKQMQRRVFPMTLLKPAQIDKAYAFIKFQNCCVVVMVSQIICEETLLEK